MGRDTYIRHHEIIYTPGMCMSYLYTGPYTIWACIPLYATATILLSGTKFSGYLKCSNPYIFSNSKWQILATRNHIFYCIAGYKVSGTLYIHALFCRWNTCTTIRGIRNLILVYYFSVTVPYGRSDSVCRQRLPS